MENLKFRTTCMCYVRLFLFYLRTFKYENVKKESFIAGDESDFDPV